MYLTYQPTIFCEKASYKPEIVNTFWGFKNNRLLDKWVFSPMDIFSDCWGLRYNWLLEQWPVSNATTVFNWNRAPHLSPLNVATQESNTFSQQRTEHIFSSRSSKLISIKQFPHFSTFPNDLRSWKTEKYLQCPSLFFHMVQRGEMQCCTSSFCVDWVCSFVFLFILRWHPGAHLKPSCSHQGNEAGGGGGGDTTIVLFFVCRLRHPRFHYYNSRRDGGK